VFGSVVGSETNPRTSAVTVIATDGGADGTKCVCDLGTIDAAEGAKCVPYPLMCTAEAEEGSRCRAGWW
jgi:hypothetical protein